MPPHEMIHGLIPSAPVGAYGGGVPPVGVELAVAEAGDFCEGVEDGLEEGEEAGEPDYEGDGRELQEPLQDRGYVQGGHFREGFAEKGRRVLRGGEPDEDAEAEAFGEAFEDEGPADGGRAGVDGLVDEGGGPPEVGEVFYGY